MEHKTIQFSRRNLLGSAAALAGTSLTGISAAQAAESAEAQKIRPLTGKMTYEEVRNRARQMMMPRCYVCPECNGRGPCIGQVPGFGGMGASRGFQANYDSLAAVQLNSRVVHDVHVPDTSIDFFGTKISMPVIAAPTGGTTYNMGGKLTEAEFVNAICGGCNKAGTLGAVADGIGDPLDVYEKRLQTLKKNGYKAIVGLKPRLQKDIMERMRLAEQAGIIALTVDLDSAGRAARATKGQTVEPKTPEQLKELVKASKLPLIFKGIMTPDEAELCVNAGAAGIVVSNHGGRTLADTPGTAAILPQIADKVNGRCFIMVDGTLARGTDIEKYLGLGANCTLAGRHFVRAAHGGLDDGVALFANRLRDELAVAMVLTGAQTVKDINRNMVVIPH
ncbi:alpha-hydroxy-acid oxidizing protein [Parasutterella muris]|uniref:Alpha-hydroxy-acid oxidizing protein n=1 Tax=Parasutterella muris TaxID=2565572 RepID=A0A6L6YLU5_9BURK|nr:alpha-hydroxy-acid oxidizing protein [Parasutterella muris]MVX57982.1 alpha-hydroxy-acid oxidizing protein [Parasutterella muris]